MEGIRLPPRGGVLRAAGVAALAALAFSVGRLSHVKPIHAGAAAADPTRIPGDPARAGKPVSLPRGEVLLLELLRTVADFNGEDVYLAADLPPDHRVTIDRVPPRLDLDAATRLLDAHGFSVSREMYRGKQVLWVQKRIARDRKQGKIVPRGETGDSRPAAPETPDAPQTAAGGIAGGPRLFRAVDAGDKAYVLMLETSSKAVAEEALSILRAHHENRAATKGVAGE